MSMDLQDFLSSRHFKQQLLRERARADRRKTYFTLVVFDFPSLKKDEERLTAMMELLAQAICKKIRISDIAGWYGASHHKIGLLLHDTLQPHAALVIQKIEKLFQKSFKTRSESTPEIVCEVYTYPSDLTTAT